MSNGVTEAVPNAGTSSCATSVTGAGISQSDNLVIDKNIPSNKNYSNSRDELDVVISPNQRRHSITRELISATASIVANLLVPIPEVTEQTSLLHSDDQGELLLKQENPKAVDDEVAVYHRCISNHPSSESNDSLEAAAFAAVAAAEAVSTSTHGDVSTAAAVAAAAAVAVANSAVCNVSNDAELVAAAVAAAAAASPSVMDSPTQAAVDAAAYVDVRIQDHMTLECSNQGQSTADDKTRFVSSITNIPPISSRKNELSKRDVIVNLATGGLEQRTGLLVYDLIYLHCVMRSATGNNANQSMISIHLLVNRIVELVENGKGLILAGMKNVPYPFMKSKGQFVTAESNDGYRILSSNYMQKFIEKVALHEMSSTDIGDLDAALLEYVTSSAASSDRDFVDCSHMAVPDSQNVILVECSNLRDDCMYEQHQANQFLFNRASQVVTSFTSTSKKRVEAAFTLMKSLQETNSASTFISSIVQDDGSLLWAPLSFEQAAEFCLIFAFEVFLEKEVERTPGRLKNDEESKSEQRHDDSIPIREPTEYDVLFGRGGMTNCHPGNRRFRDIITLHRADYVRAIKMDKPAVAKKIVKAIRVGNPPGRFLRKSDDGLWYDVGDRNAAEKTSQGLRERTNREKRERSALRESLRFKKSDALDDTTFGETNRNSPRTESKSADALSKSSQVEATERLTIADTDLEGDNLPSPSVGLNSSVLLPNAVDKNGNILVADYDILCGRGGLTNHHKGNKRFRDIVALHRSDYVRAPKIQKPSVARVIVRAIRNGDPPGRFLKKDEKSGKWLDVGDKKAAEKTSQALREKIVDEHESGKSTAFSHLSFKHVSEKEVTIEFDADKLLATISATVAAVPATKQAGHACEQDVHNITMVTLPRIPNPGAPETVGRASEVNPNTLLVTDRSDAASVKGEGGNNNSQMEVQVASQLDIPCDTLDCSGRVIAKSEQV